jgi:hypothetical protein
MDVFIVFLLEANIFSRSHPSNGKPIYIYPRTFVIIQVIEFVTAGGILNFILRSYSGTSLSDRARGYHFTSFSLHRAAPCSEWALQCAHVLWGYAPFS